MDGLGVAIDPKDGSVYYGRGTYNFSDPLLQATRTASRHYSLKDEAGSIIRVSPDFKNREVVATGIRFPVGLHFNKARRPVLHRPGSATWVPNGNPLDELLHIRLDKVRHYGFPARHPKHLPDVIDEPSTFDYGPQHQSTCGFCFNEPVKKDGPIVRAGTTLGGRRHRDGRVSRQALTATATGEDRRGLRREESTDRVPANADH